VLKRQGNLFPLGVLNTNFVRWRCSLVNWSPPENSSVSLLLSFQRTFDLPRDLPLTHRRLEAAKFRLTTKLQDSLIPHR
jgi:hypothetical protein